MISVLLAIKIGLDPTLVEIAGAEITWHGLFTAVGVMAGVALAAWFGRRAAFDEDTIYNVALALVIGGIIGARGLFVLENLDTFKDDPGDIFRVNTGGISIYGALIGGAAGAWLYAIIRHVPNIPRGADIAAMAAIVGMAIGRIGDVINGEHFASSTGLPWGVIYTNQNSPSFLRFGPNADPQHPAVAYELIGDLLIFAVLFLVYRRSQRAGVTFFSWVFLYGLLRVFVSFLRSGDEIILLGLRMAQLIALATMPLGIAGVIYLLRTPPREQRLTRAERRREKREAAEAEEKPAG